MKSIDKGVGKQPQKPGPARKAELPSHSDVTGAGERPTKYKRIYDDLKRAIGTGSLQPGDRLPSEAELGDKYQASRITIARAIGELCLEGLLSRRPGAGTHVLAPKSVVGHVFGVLIPDRGKTEIFDPICYGMMQSPLSRQHSLLWGHDIEDAGRQEDEAEHLCHSYIAQKVSGVFFAPLELTPGKDAVNTRILAALDRAGISTVLLDRCHAPYHMRSKYDLVGIDNRRAGFLITQHLLVHGGRRLAFVAKPLSASTITARIAGYREALAAHGQQRQSNLVRYGDPADLAFVRKLLKECKPGGIVCGNDATAASLMASLAALHVSVPEDVRVVGVDDVKYAALLPIPLTTQHQNCRDIGAMAMATMLQRLDEPNLPARDVLLQTHTVVRRSCGTSLTSEPA